MLEMIIVVAIVVILAAVSFVGVVHHLRGMTKLEYDGYAREIFMAAQDHLSMAKSQGYLGRTNFGTDDKKADGKDAGTYYFVVRKTGDSAAALLSDDTAVLNLMLPEASVDETIRLGGSYIVRYDRDSAQVRDVFYWSETAARFKLTYNDSDYALFFSSDLKNYGSGKAVVGHYGGVEIGSGMTTTELKAPFLRIYNAEVLKVIVTDPNSGSSYVEAGWLELMIIGESSGAKETITLKSPGESGSGEYTYVLDDITQPFSHFFEKFPDFTPGEDITLQAVSYSNSGSNTASSNSQTTNSLFATGSTVQASGGTAQIGNIRHLENLSNDISCVGTVGNVVGGEAVGFSKAQQTSDLSWQSFRNSDAFSGGNIRIYTADNTPSAVTTVNGEEQGTFLPVFPEYSLDYDGRSHIISHVVISTSGTAGLFGTMAANSSISDLELLDFSVTSSNGNAGALLGKQDEYITVNNVLARSSSGGSGVTVQGAGSVGGLIGSISGGEVTKCAAALVVKSTGGDAGGLIGAADSGAEITASYSGGHTKADTAAYDKDNYNVTAAGSAGGLIGSAGEVTVQACYSTCSASGVTAGGLAGSLDGGSVTDSYAVGLVSGSSREGAFAGTASGTSFADNEYFEIINEYEVRDSNNVHRGYDYLGPVGGAAQSGITALDADAAAYNAFVGPKGDWDTAAAYDSRLFYYYQNQYTLKTVAELGAAVDADDYVATHYGDWPAPELWTLNAPD